jgi:predicted TIM-barrel fold metal-dependent hydrolase
MTTAPSPDTNTDLKISSDSHMAEPFDLWEKGLPAKYSDHRLRYPDREYGKHQHSREGGWLPGPRLKDMALDRVAAEVLYPTLAKDVFRQTDRNIELAHAAATVYNEWLIDFCSESPERLWGQALIPLWDIDWALAELDRCKKGGLAGTTTWMIPPEGLAYDTDHYERFWAESADLGMPVSMHINMGFGEYFPAFQSRQGLTRLKFTTTGHKQITMDALTDIICSGVLERHPDLKIVVAEAEIGFIPFWLNELDKRMPQGSIPLKPSEYFYRQVYACFGEDEVGGRLLTWYMHDNAMYATDYPHPGEGNVWPFSDSVVGRVLGHLEPEIRAKVLRENVAKLYGRPVPAAMPMQTDDGIEEYRKTRSHYGI